MTGWRVIVQVETPRRTECVTFADVPLVDSAHIAVVAHSPSAAAIADTLFDEIIQQLGAVAPATSCGRARLLSCQGRTEPTCRSVLALVTDATPIAAASL